MQISKNNITELAWDKGLLPAIVQDATTGQVLMQGYMNQNALAHTLESQQVTFYSRSKERLWTKGESSGHTLEVSEVFTDCDKDSILVLAKPNGPTCHLGTQSCFANDAADLGFIAELEALIQARKGQDASSSYTATLYAQGVKRIAQKVGEEGLETALAAATDDIEELKNESADLLYHLLVLLAAKELSLQDIVAVLQARHRGQ